MGKGEEEMNTLPPDSTHLNLAMQGSGSREDAVAFFARHGVPTAAPATTENLVQGSDAWLQARKDLSCTASEFSAVCSRNYFKKRHELMEEKLDRLPRFEGNEATQWGNDHEPDAIKRFEKDKGVRVLSTGLWRHPVYTHIGGSPDGIIDDDSGGIVEVKCPFSKRDMGRLPRHRRCPVMYVDQIQGLMEIMDKKYCWLIVWNPNDVSYVRVERDRSYWAQRMLPMILSFCYELNKARGAPAGPNELQLSAGDFGACCRRNAFLSRRDLMLRKLRRFMKARPTKRALGKKQTARKSAKRRRLAPAGSASSLPSSAAKTAFDPVSSPLVAFRRGDRSPTTCRLRYSVSVRLTAKTATLPVELQRKIWIYHHQIQFSRVLRQVRRTVPLIREYTKRCTSTPRSTMAYVRWMNWDRLRWRSGMLWKSIIRSRRVPTA